MLIRTQSKSTLINLNSLSGVCIEAGYIIKGCEVAPAVQAWTLGKYSTIEKALKVLDMIQEQYENFSDIYDFVPPKVFVMPKDEEVEDDNEQQK